MSVADGRITAVGGVHEEARRTALRTIDDTGFWAFGEFTGVELHHVGYVMRLGGR